MLIDSTYHPKLEKPLPMENAIHSCPSVRRKLNQAAQGELGFGWRLILRVPSSLDIFILAVLFGVNASRSDVLCIVLDVHCWRCLVRGPGQA